MLDVSRHLIHRSLYRAVAVGVETAWCQKRGSYFQLALIRTQFQQRVHQRIGKQIVEICKIRFQQTFNEQRKARGIVHQ